MMKIIMLILSVFAIQFIYAVQPKPFPSVWPESYHEELLNRAGEKIAHLSTFPTLMYPNDCHQNIANLFPDNKVLLFGYGSLMNEASAMRSMKPETAKTMQPVIAFGLKRMFNYKANKTDHWGSDQHPLEKAMLNVVPMTTFNHIINGVVFEVDAEEFSMLVLRERGYDLVPILVANWDQALNQDSDVDVRVAYTFLVPNETRSGISYTQHKYYPVRGYLHAVREGAVKFGEPYLRFFNCTTFLANGTTRVSEWDEETFAGKLCSKEP